MKVTGASSEHFKCWRARHSLSVTNEQAPHELAPGKYAWWKLPPGERSYTALAYIGVDEVIGHMRFVVLIACAYP